MKKLIVNQDTCIGCGACVQIDEEHFDFSPKGTSVATNQENLESETVAMAIDACPVGAISITEDEDAAKPCHCASDNEESEKSCHCASDNEDSKCHCHDEDDSSCTSCEHNCNN